MGEHEIRLSKEQFDVRMRKIQSRYAPIKRRDISACKHWLSGLLKCGYCGSSLSYNGKNRKTCGFQCYKYAKGMHSGSSFISEKKAICGVYEYFEKLLDGMDFEYEYRIPKLRIWIHSAGHCCRSLGNLLPARHVSALPLKQAWILWRNTKKIKRDSRKTVPPSRRRLLT